MTTPSDDAAPERVRVRRRVRRRSARKWWIITAVVVVLALAGVVIAATSGSSGPKKKPVAAVTHTPSPTPTPTPTPTVTQTPAETALHEKVPAAAPTQFRIWGPKFDIKAHVCGMLNIRPLDPPGEQHHTVCWVDEGFGVAPGSSTGTTYILGHAWAEDDQEVLNALSSTVMKQVLITKPVQVTGASTYPVNVLDGYHISLTTNTGTLTYTVKDAYAVPKEQAAEVAPLMDQHTPNRVVVITCGELNHQDYDYNIIVDAYLSESVAAKA